MARKIYRNGYADGGIVPMGIHNVSSWNFIPNEQKKRNVASFVNFLNSNY